MTVRTATRSDAFDWWPWRLCPIDRYQRELDGFAGLGKLRPIDQALCDGGYAMPDLLDPDEASAYLQDWKGRIDKMAGDTQAMSDRLAGLRVSARDDDGIVEVTIDSGGALVDIDFTDRIHRVAPGAVSRAVLRALRSARIEAAGRTREIVTETMGPDSVAARTIADRMEEQLRKDPLEGTRHDA